MKTTGKKPPTQPWNAADNPFIPDITKLKVKRKGFRVRWADPSRVQRWRDEGWVMAEAVNYGGKQPGATDSTVRSRGLVLMELPEEMARRKEEYLENVTAVRSASHVKKVKADVRKIEKDLGYDVNFKEGGYEGADLEDEATAQPQ